jgi:hypothetical protein
MIFKATSSELLNKFDNPKAAIAKIRTMGDDTAKKYYNTLTTYKDLYEYPPVYAEDLYLMTPRSQRHTIRNAAPPSAPQAAPSAQAPASTQEPAAKEAPKDNEGYLRMKALRGIK